MWYIAIDITTDIVNVTSYYKMTMFTTDSKYLREFGIPGRGVGELNTLYGLPAESTGNLYICDLL